MNRFVALLRTLVSRTLAIFRTSSAERDLDEELQTHLNLAVEENLRNGMAPEAARSAALRAFGGVTQTRETYRTQRGVTFLPVLLQDLRYGFRQLWKSPGFAVVAIGSLALGIGASVAVFSVVRAVLLDPYPYKDADRMIHVELRDKSTPHGRLLAVTSTEFKDVQQLPSVDDVFLMDQSRQALTGDSLPVSVNVGSYTANLFTYMGVPPLLGREFTPADAPGGNASPVAVLSYLFWKKQYGGQHGIVGKTIELDHALYTVIGVANPRFTWGDSEVYLPGNFKADPHYYMLPFIKLKPGATHESLIAQLQPLVDRYAQQDPTNFPQGRKVGVVTLNEEVLGNFQSALLMLFGSVLLLLLIGCANVSILMLARGVARQHEFAVRSSVGAGRGRILRQLLTEAVMLSMTGAALGVLLAYRGVDLIATNLPMYSFPHEASAAIHVNGAVLLFAVGVALLTGVLFGLSPAWQLSRAEASSLTQSNSTRMAGSLRGRHAHRVLIAGQVALTMLLLASAGAAMRAFLSLSKTPLGINPHNLFYMALSLPKEAPHTWQYLANSQESIRNAAESTLGVESASVSTTWLPPFGGFRGKIAVSSNPNLTDAQADLALVSPTIFTALQVPLLSGRFFTPEEDARAAHVALVNQTFVKRYFPDGDPLGKNVRSPALKMDNPHLVATDKPDDWLQIVGVVDDARNDGLDRPVQPQIFLPDSFVLDTNTFLVVRAKGDPAAAMRAVGQSIHRLNPGIFVVEQHEIGWLLDTQGWATERFLASIFALFAVLALLLAATGIYSVVSYTVSQRTREFGVRMALGARRAAVVRLVLQASLLTVAGGAIIGIVLSLSLSKLISTSSHATMRDPLMLAGVSALLLAVTALACLYPAWRAASIDPMQSLRLE
jgi:putative ABC transport system permease protein